METINVDKDPVDINESTEKEIFANPDVQSSELKSQTVFLPTEKRNGKTIFVLNNEHQIAYAELAPDITSPINYAKMEELIDKTPYSPKAHGCNLIRAI